MKFILVLLFIIMQKSIEINIIILKLANEF